jgi:Asp-tRNA(Asn)/Glu-tRNA(Gln) amidotransferase A subunit family amidase
VVDHLMAGGEGAPDLPALPVAGLRLAVLDGFVAEGWDAVVAATFERALSRLSAAGARIERLTVPELADIPPPMRGRLRGERGLGLAPGPGGPEGRRLRPAHPRPHPAG